MPRSPKKTAYKTNGSSVADLNKELFQAAINLRGSIEPADYKRYVLPVIFLRFLSLRFERRRAELEHMVADKNNREYYQLELAVDDPDEYRSVGAFVLPEEARWTNIKKQARQDDIKVHLDNVLELLENTYPDQLKGLLPPIYAGSNLERENLASLIDLFSKDIFSQDYGQEDLIGRVYEYFIGEFANSEGKRGGEYFTPSSIVRTLVAMLEPENGKVFDPCCGSGGMFVQSDIFTHHSGNLAFYGQESKDFTYRLCRMNLFIHGINGNIQMGNSYTDDRHDTLKADYLLANPPFNDGSKGDNGWGADRIPDKDPRLLVGGEKMPLSTRNANTMWILHFLNHLSEGGTAGFVMATGELSNSEIARLEVRKSLIEKGYVDCVVQLSGQLFANTQIPCGLWFLSKNRTGNGIYRNRTDEILFIDGRQLGTLISGSRKQKELANDEIKKIADIYHFYKIHGAPETIRGFCSVANIDTIRANNYVITPGRYVGAYNNGNDDEGIEEKLPRLISELKTQLEESERMSDDILALLKAGGLDG